MNNILRRLFSLKNYNKHIQKIKIYDKMRKKVYDNEEI